MSQRNSISEARNVIITFDDGTAAQLGSSLDSYAAALELVTKMEGRFAKLGATGQPDLTDASVLATGRIASQIHVFTITSVMATGNYEIVYVETRPNVDNEL